MEDNKLGTRPMKKLVWEMGLPLLFSMVAQALYNIVDTAFVINMPEDGISANLALTYSFPVQIFMIAVGVGLGIGVNALLSRNLGQGDRKGAGETAGNGLFIAAIVYVVFLLFGLFGSRAFIAMQAGGDEKVIELGASYLTICTTLSLGQVFFTVYERLLQASGNAMYATIGQLAGAVTNIVLDYVLIFPAGLGVQGAAYATVIGQFLSLGLDMLFHFLFDRSIPNSPRYLKPKKEVIKGIFKLGIPAMIMQALLSFMMLGVNLILGVAPYDRDLISGAFGIYYKIQQIPLFASFGMSNALISIVGYNAGQGNKERVEEAKKYGILDTVIASAVLVILFEALATPIAKLFGMASGESATSLMDTVTKAIRIASVGYLFMAYSIAVQGILQGLRAVYTPVFISLLRLAVFVFPLAYVFSLSSNVSTLLWLAFPISEVLTSIFSFLFLRMEDKKRIQTLKAPNPATTRA